jgi:signal transduction histidine kinase
MGLGLSVIETILESHNIHIWVESNIGEGSTFTILLPIKEPAK